MPFTEHTSQYPIGFFEEAERSLIAAALIIQGMSHAAWH